MNKKVLVISTLILVISIFTIISQTNSNKESNEAFHVTLADPQQYENGVYSSTFILESGDYVFRFVPNGDSPQNLTIKLEGEKYEFSENFQLNGTLHKTGISEYYTWDYNGQKSIKVSPQQEISIQINPNGNVKGSVSVDIIKN